MSKVSIVIAKVYIRMVVFILIEVVYKILAGFYYYCLILIGNPLLNNDYRFQYLSFDKWL